MRFAVLAAALLVAGLTAAAAPANDLLELYGGVEAAADRPPGVPAARTSTATSGGRWTTTVRLEITGTRNADGSVHVLLFDDAAAYQRLDAGAAAAYLRLPAADAAAVAALEAIGEAPYAAFVFHDENDNAVFDRDGARPREGYGYSGAVEPYMPPPFSTAASIRDEAKIRLHYLPDRRMRR